MTAGIYGASLPPSTPDIPAFDVTIKNWSEFNAKPPVVANTTVKTYSIDPAGVATNNDSRRTQISDYEPNRLRMVIMVIDSPILLCKEVPPASPDISTAAVPGTGRYLANGLFEYILYGPDAWWINSISGGAATRVTVTKEYC